MSRRMPSIVIIAISLVSYIGAINSAATGPFDGITFGQKVVASPRPRVTIPPLPSLPPLISLTPTQAKRLQPTPFPRAQSAPTSYNGLGQQQPQQQFQLRQGQQLQQQQQQQQQQIQQAQFQKAQQGQRVQAGLGSDLTSPEVYVIDGRQLKQYKVYEQIDNDIDQEVENFIPPNFFLSNYHARISPTHTLGEDLQLQTRSSAGRSQQNNQQVSNTIALGSGGLGFVTLPNGNVYLGSGSLGYTSNLQRNQDLINARTRQDFAETPDALHFGHGPLTDNLYYRN